MEPAVRLNVPLGVARTLGRGSWVGRGRGVTLGVTVGVGVGVGVTVGVPQASSW